MVPTLIGVEVGVTAGVTVGVPAGAEVGVSVTAIGVGVSVTAGVGVSVPDPAEIGVAVSVGAVVSDGVEVLVELAEGSGQFCGSWLVPTANAITGICEDG